MRIWERGLRRGCDGKEPNEAEEPCPCCVPIDPVHVISSPKNRREQERYQNSGSSGRKTHRITALEWQDVRRTQRILRCGMARDRNTNIRRVREAPIRDWNITLVSQQ